MAHAEMISFLGGPLDGTEAEHVVNADDRLEFNADMTKARPPIAQGDNLPNTVMRRHVYERSIMSDSSMIYMGFL